MAAFKDYNAEMKALQQRARDLRHKHSQQLGDLVVATGADALDPPTLAGVLLAAVGANKSERAAWQTDGARFLEGRTRARRKAASVESGGDPDQPGAGSGGAKTGAD